MYRFIDELLITVKAGCGGSGCLSFKREKYKPYGGPDGGNGGNGGNILLKASRSVNTLSHLSYKKLYIAENGKRGSGNNKTGKDGSDLVLLVPIGTLVFNADTNQFIEDLNQDQDQILIANGGLHGSGNSCFKNSTFRSPKKITFGKTGEQYTLRLELRLLIDVGLLGLPNSGKSTLVQAISNAKSTVSNYPFTTTYPILGTVNISNYHRFVIADMPSLVKGSHHGLGYGNKFLKHLFRSRIILYLIDITSNGELDIINSIKYIINEIKNYSNLLLIKPIWLVINKMDMIDKKNIAIKKKIIEKIQKELLWKNKIFFISSIYKYGVSNLCKKIIHFLNKK